MNDFPAFILAATVWLYWIGACFMVASVSKKGIKAAGLTPQQKLEQLLWPFWVPLIVAWNVLPYLALTRPSLFPLVSSAFLAQPAVRFLRWIAALLAVFCLVATIDCWRQMGDSWSIGIIPHRRTKLVTAGFYASMRHPIYAFSILLMLCSLVLIPTLAMIFVTGLHLPLLFFKARNEERFLLGVHGEKYRHYCQRTGRFFPRLLSRQATFPSELQ